MHMIIHVADPAVPNGASQCPGTGPADAPGYYFVLVAGPKRGGRLRRRCFGPFATLAQARLVQKSAVALGLDPAPQVGIERREESLRPSCWNERLALRA